MEWETKLKRSPSTEGLVQLGNGFSAQKFFPLFEQLAFQLFQHDASLLTFIVSDFVGK
ncbi:hypothetical protein NST18_04505 [Anoxybacillus sp. FSL W8-0104]|uniref:Uncharacterized protein n=1 Tax=Anoxybacillus flavithermus TaxID=33934 RepID=A0A178THL8_9BACL|nr:hypothetical protein [Anoxybacillus flavithermus]MBE2955070.1 hypothetical protein [Anoxybacillus flavithermus]OAO80819.1 hypothetical protein A0O32_1287 [Anoxybacillus flavithermus]OAO81418.1 hypothetical protein TAF16_0728 [Anoxybacillus flavithermus]